MLRVVDVMTSPVEHVDAAMPAEDAWERMRTRGVRHLVVLRGGRLAGVLSARDLGTRATAAFRRGLTVGELMTPRPASVPAGTSVRRAANVMRGRSIGSLIVTDSKGGPLGIITTSDLLSLIGRGLEPRPTTQRWSLRHRVPHTPQSSGRGLW